MRKSIEINGKKYTPARLELDELCLIEEMGVPIDEIGARKISMVRAYVAVTIDCSKEEATAELQAHLDNGGDFAELTEYITEAIEESGFFRSISKEKKETPTEKAPTEAKAKK